jgi:ketosteroid isomerase-like protein
MPILLVILVVVTALIVALINGSGGGSGINEGLTITVIIIAIAIGIILVKLMWDDHQAERLRDGKPRLKFSKRKMLPVAKRGILALLGILGLALGIQAWRAGADAPTSRAQAESQAPLPESAPAMVKAPEPKAEPSGAKTAPPPTPAAPSTPVATESEVPPPGPIASETTANTRAEVRAALDDWLAAWSKRQVDAYLQHYDARFTPPDGMSRGAWEKQRRERLGKARDISIRIESLSFGALAGNTAEVSFVQHYASSNYRESSRKTVVFARGGQGWRIQHESSAPL